MAIGLGVNIQKKTQALAGAVRDAIVDGNHADLLLDFNSDYYLANGGRKPLDEVLTHSRAGNATMVASDGLIKWAPHNFLTYSEQFDNAAWTKTAVSVTSDSTAAPDGAITADTLIPTATSSEHAVFRQFVGYTIGVAYTFSVYAKTSGYDLQLLFGLNDVAGNPYANFDLTSGSVAVDTGLSAAISSVGDGWYLCQITGVASGGGGDFTVAAFPIDETTQTRAPTYTGDGTSGIYIWGAHLYRSDLGGMAPVPAGERSFPSASTYVPTTSSARYLPRVGHHVYNGSAWVNEGVLAESEARTNLLPYSSDFTNPGWSKTDVSVTADQAVSPSGQADADELDFSASTSARIAEIVSTGAGTYTFSIWLRAVSGSGLFIIALLKQGGSAIAKTVTLTEEWQRFTVSFDYDGATNLIAYAGYYIGAGYIQNVYAWGAQLEAAPTPSSYIPTAGATVTRAAETLTIPSANLPWPTPQVIGDELVTNGTFDTDTSGWTASNATLSVESGELKITSTGGNRPQANQAISTTVGKVYEISAIARTTAGTGDIEIEISGIGSDTSGSTSSTTNTRIFNVFTATASFHILQVKIDDAASVAGEVAYFDNVSVREINPLSVSIQMDGRMTYADTDNAEEAIFARWQEDANNNIALRLRTNVGSGRIDFVQFEASGGDAVFTSGSVFSPGILVPFNIASRHGSTFINGAVDGVALTANTTPVALPDLSSTDLNLGQTYMGTIKTFRIWDKDLGDAGIEEATAPSLEPSLELVFDGSQSSFVVLDWEN